MKTSSESSHFAMRPEYLAEFEAAGIPPPSDLPLRHEEHRAEIPLGPTGYAPAHGVRKIILHQPAAIHTDLLASNLAAIIGGMYLVLRIAVIPLIIVGALVARMLAAERRGRRRGWHW